MTPWLDRFVRRRLLHENPDFACYAVTDGRGETCVVVVPTDSVRPDASCRLALSALADAHRDPPADSLIAPLERAVLEGPEPYVSFAVHPTVSGSEIVRALQARSTKIPYAEAAHLMKHVISGALSAHRADGGPHRVGRLSWSNFIVDTEGALHVLGFGHNVICDDRHGALSRPTSAVISPIFESMEYGAGAEPTEASELFAFTLFLHSMMHLVELPESLAQAIATGPSEGPEAPLELWSMARIIGAFPAQRATLKETLDAIHSNLLSWGDVGTRETLGHELRALVEVIDKAQAPIEPTHELVVWGADLGRVELDGRPVVLSSHPTLRRLLCALLDAHGRAESMDVWALFEAGWPDTRASHDSVKNRVHVALSRLRRTGLEACIERGEDGYRIADDVIVRCHD